MSEIITIDGPTSSGKSSVGYFFSQKIGYQFIDSGGIYRAACLKVLEHGISVDDIEAIKEIFKNLDIKFEPRNSRQHIFLDGVDVTDKLHSPEVTSIVPTVASNAEIREIAKGIQRRIGFEKDTVMTGRDIGSEIFPEAKLKFFITASVDVRAKRRYDQLKRVNPEIAFEEVLEQTKLRDDKDTHRAASPMRIPEGAIAIDTTEKTIDQSVSILLDHFNRLYS